MGAVGWSGSQIDGMRDASGLMYRRNRYYDPSSGRFTQEDPIGIAGGLNVYGFAEGDPVTYSDPYGLCPYHETGVPCGAVWGVQGAVGGAIIGAVVGGSGGTVLAPGAGTVVGGVGGGVEGALLGGTAGVVAGTMVDAGYALGLDDSFGAGIRNVQERVASLGTEASRFGKRAREWVIRTGLAAALGLSMNPAVPTTPTDPCGDAISGEVVDCGDTRPDTASTPRPEGDK